MIYKYVGINPIYDNKSIEIVCPNQIIETSNNYGVIYNISTNKTFKLSSYIFNSILNECTPAESSNSIGENNSTENKVNHSVHYTWLKDKCGIEVIDITRHMDFDLGNALKYILRCGHKSEQGYFDKDKAIENLKKAIFYINDKIKMLNE